MSFFKFFILLFLNASSCFYLWWWVSQFNNFYNLIQFTILTLKMSAFLGFYKKIIANQLNSLQTIVKSLLFKCTFSL